jgi:hypothetical protein
MEEEFLVYLSNWESEVQKYTDLTSKARGKLLLSRETMEGLCITGTEYSGTPL